jgi:hypothetical protein
MFPGCRRLSPTRYTFAYNAEGQDYADGGGPGLGLELGTYHNQSRPRNCQHIASTENIREVAVHARLSTNFAKSHTRPKTARSPAITFNVFIREHSCLEQRAAKTPDVQAPQLLLRFFRSRRCYPSWSRHDVKQHLTCFRRPAHLETACIDRPPARC